MTGRETIDLLSSVPVKMMNFLTYSWTSCCNVLLPARRGFPVLLLGGFMFDVMMEICSVKGNYCHQKIIFSNVGY